MPERAPRGLLWRWLGWFGLANAAVLGVIALRYLGPWQGGETPLAWLYLVTIYVSHHAWLALLPLLVVVGPLVLVWPRPGAVKAAGALVMASAVAVMVLDSLLWAESRFDINQLTARILGVQSWVFVGVMFAIALVFEALLARGAWRWVGASRRRGGGRVAAAIAACFVIAQGIHAWADAAYYTPVTGLGQQLPVHGGFTAKKLLARSGLVDIRQSRERQLAGRISRDLDKRAGEALAYPLEPLECAAQPSGNLLIVMLDAWRFDMLGPEHTPDIHRWAGERATRFERHFSGGNSSRMGVFSFFYGLPPGYFDSFEATQTPALLIREAQRRNVQLGLFTSADMYRPVALDRTAFASVPGLRVTPEHPDAPAWQRDLDLVAEWRAWLDARDPSRPFLGFLFFDATNAQSFPPDYPQHFDAPPGHPKADAWAAYRKSIHYVDSLVGRVLADLAGRGLADDTVVMVTSDHGEEFMESGPGIEDHGSAFSRWQLQVPMLLSWPGRAPAAVNRRTSHYDVAPTLVGRWLGCENPPSDYSSGEDLFAGDGWDWLIAGSYYNYAVLEPDQVTVTFPNGLYEVRDADYRPVVKPEFRGDVLEEVMRENRRFHR